MALISAHYPIIHGHYPSIQASLARNGARSNQFVGAKLLLNLRRSGLGNSKVSSLRIVARGREEDGGASCSGRAEDERASWFSRFSSAAAATAIAVALMMSSEPLDATAAAVLTPRRLQGDELQTVELFQENTPSVVYITNLAVRYARDPESCSTCNYLLNADAFVT